MEVVVVAVAVVAAAAAAAAVFGQRWRWRQAVAFDGLSDGGEQHRGSNHCKGKGELLSWANEWGWARRVESSRVESQPASRQAGRQAWQRSP